MRELKETASDKPYIFHLGAQAHVGESWHRPYETVMANTVGTLNLLQSAITAGGLSALPAAADAAPGIARRYTPPR